MDLKIDFNFYRTRLVEVMDTYPPPSERIGTCLDVGANVGAFSLVFSNYCDKVISIEPYKENYNYMISKIEHYGIDNVIPINKAIFPESGKKVEMRVLSEGTDSKDITINEKKDWGKDYTGRGTINLGSVETISLEDIIKEHGEIDYMKVDCEGCEWDLLYNRDMSKVKMVVTETHPGYIGEEKYNKLIDYLTNEFDVKYTYHEEYKHQDPVISNIKDVEFIFRREGTPKYEDNIYIKFKALRKPNGPIQKEWLKNIKRYV